MSFIKNECELSEKKVIEILNKNGITVIMKPKALMPELLGGSFPTEESNIMTTETDIFEALTQLKRRFKIIGDPNVLD